MTAAEYQPRQRASDVGPRGCSGTCCQSPAPDIMRAGGNGAYLRAGETRAATLGNRGPIRFEPDGTLAADILEAYWRVGFYVFTGVLDAPELANIEADVATILDRAPASEGAALDVHGRPALGADCNAPNFFWARPLGDPWGGTSIANGRHPARMFEPTPAAGCASPRVTVNFGFHRRASVLGLTAGGVHNARAIYDEARIRERSRVIGYAIDARRRRFPAETPYVYQPIVGTRTTIAGPMPRAPASGITICI